MLKTPRHSHPLIQSCLLFTLLVPSGHALAANGNIKSMSLNLAVSNGAVQVISKDGRKWSAIKLTELGISGPIAAKMKTGYISSYHLRLGVCGDDAQCNEAYPVIYGPKYLGAWDMSLSKNVSFAMNTEIAPVSGGGGIAPNPSFDSIIGKCNALLSQGKSIYKEHTLSAEFGVTFAVETDGALISDFNDSGDIDPPVDFRQSDYVPVKVICEAADQPDLAPPPIAFKVTGAELYLATFKGDGPAPSQGASCKVLKVTARFPTTKAGLVHFDLSHKVGDQGLKTTPITIESKQRPDGTFAAEYVNHWYLDKATYAQFMVQETDGQGLSAGWKDINVICDNQLADPTSQPPSDGPEFKVLTSKFTVTTYKSESVSGCPVNAALDIEFVTNKPGSVPFKVTGTDGFVWNNSVKAEEALGPLQVGEDQAQFATTYRAKHQRMLTVTKATDADYSLEVRNVAVEPSAKHAGPDNLKVSCAGDLAVPFAVMETELNIVGLPGFPTTAFAAETFVTNWPGNVRYRLSATTGEVETGTAQAKKVGNRFVAKYQLPVKITKGGEVIFVAMPLDFPKKLRLAKKQYNCGGPNPGDVSGGRRPTTKTDPKKVVVVPPKLVTPPKVADPKKTVVTPPRLVMPPKPPKKTVVPVIVTPKPLTCCGGTVRGGKCVCPSGFQTVKQTATSFRCVKPKPSVLTLPPKPKPSVLTLPTKPVKQKAKPATVGRR